MGDREQRLETRHRIPNLHSPSLSVGDGWLDSQRLPILPNRILQTASFPEESSLVIMCQAEAGIHPEGGPVQFRCALHLAELLVCEH